MKILYHCYGGAHSSVIAAHLHLGNLPLKGPVSPQDILALAEFDRADKSDWGIPNFIGTDEMGHEVFSLGLGNQTDICCRAIISLACRMGKADEIILVKTLPAIGTLTRIGGFSSKVMGMKNFGRKLAAYGIVRSIHELRELVRATKKYLEWKNNG